MKLFACFLLLIVSTTGVFAQETTIDLDPFISEVASYVLVLVSAVIGLAVSYAVALLRRWTGINIEAKHRDALQSALLNGARKAITKITPSGVKIDVKNAVIADGVDYVLKSVPDALEYFDLTPERVREMIEAKLPAVDTPVVEK